MKTQSNEQIDVVGLVNEARAILAKEDVYELREFLGKTGLYKVHDYLLLGNRPVGTYPCGSVSVEDTPKSVYRMLYLFRPERVSFQDMYKANLLTIVSPDYAFVAELELFKYEFAVYFQASREHISGTKQHCVLGGAPGTDNGIKHTSEAAAAWFKLLVELLTREWMVYGGNNFSV